MAYYPNADKSIKGNNSGSFTGGPFKGVIHTTEGSSASGAIGAFRSNNSWPHFLIDYVGKIWQFLDTNKGGRALRNLSGGVQTNLDSAIQLEIVGFAGKPTEHPAAQMNALKALMRWIEQTTGVKPVGPGRLFANSYGQNHLRFTNAEWDNFNGWCGHCHVPENSHWDPGTIDLMLPSSSIPTNYYTEVSIVPFTASRNQGGYIVVGGDGGVFTYDTPFHGSLGGTPLNTPIVAATWSLTGEGYWLMSSDGAIFSFGDASYKGGFNALTPEQRGNRKPIGIIAKGNGYRIVTLDPSNDDSMFDGYDFGI